VPESFAYFLTEKYDEVYIRNVLKEEADYICPPSHEDCVIHNAANYLFSIQHSGASFDVLEKAVDVRRGDATKNDVEVLLKQRREEVKTPTKKIKEEIELMTEELGIDIRDIKNNKQIKLC
jgi:hypothetical protein